MKRKPIGFIDPDLYQEEDTGLWLTATDFAARNECAIEEIREEYNGRRPASTYYE